MPDYTFFLATAEYLSRDPDPAISKAAARLVRALPKPVACPQCGAATRYQSTGERGRVYRCSTCQVDYYLKG